MKNKYTRLLEVILAIIFLAACATTGWERDVMTAESLVKEGKYSEAFDIYIEHPRHSGALKTAQQMRTLINENPAFKSQVPQFFQKRIDKTTDANGLIFIRKEIIEESNVGVISKDSEKMLLDHLDRVAAEANRTGRINFLLSDDYKVIPTLATSESEGIIFKRSLNMLTDKSKSPPSDLAQRVIEHAAKLGPKSPEYAMVQKALPDMNLRIDDLKEHATKVSPDFAKKSLADRTVVVRLVTEPDDRLLQEDVGVKLKALSPAVLLAAPDQKPTVKVTLKRLQWDEERTPERSQTVSYGQFEVNVVASLLLMPKNASYLYEVTTGGAELRYAFEIKASGKGMPPYDYLLRDKISREWRSCSNARIQNVFGGVQRADFIANQHMQSMCSGSGSPVSMDALRDEALNQVVKSIANVPVIAQAIAANR